MSGTTTTSSMEQGQSGKKATTHKSKMPMVLFAVTFLVVGAAIAAVVAVATGNSDPVVPTHTVDIRFTAAGDVSDYNTAKKESVLLELAKAAGFSATPAGSTLTVTAASVIVIASLAVADDAAGRSASAALQLSIPTQAKLQTALAGVVGGGVTIQSAPTLRTVAADAMPLLGTWVTNYGSYITVTEDAWWSFTSYGNSRQTLGTWNATSMARRNGPDASYNPNKWVRSEHHFEADGSAGYCDIVHDAETELAALNADVSASVVVANASTNGCGGQFAHTFMTPYNIPIAGAWSNGALTITNDLWDSKSTWGDSNYTIIAYGAGFAIAQNGPGNSYNAGKFSRFNYHDITATGFEYCQTIYAADTALLALTTAGVYDAANKTHGCGGSFSHSAITA